LVDLFYTINSGEPIFSEGYESYVLDSVYVLTGLSPRQIKHLRPQLHPRHRHTPNHPADANSRRQPQHYSQTHRYGNDIGTNQSNLQYSVDGGSLNTLNTDISGKFDDSPPNSPLATCSHTSVIEATDTAGNQTSQNINFQVTNSFTVAPPQTTGWGATSTDTVLLAERNSKLVQALLPVQLGQATGSHTLRFQFKADFDKTDTASAIEDLFQIYLVSPNDPNQALLDGGTPGTALFSLAGSKAEFVPGRVRYSGDTVEIDLSSLTNSSSGNLLLRLTDSDTDTGSTVEVRNLTNTVDEEPLAGVLVGLGELRAITAADGSCEIRRLEFPSLVELGLPDIVPPDTLQIYGDGISGEDNYPYIAEKLPLLLEHEVYSNVNNVISRPIYLPPLDTANGENINPVADTTVTTAAIPKASVFVKAGSLKDAEGEPYTENLSITEVPTELTPAALPPNLHTDLVVTIQPGDMVFTTPVPLSLPNRAGYAPGSTMDLWSINPTTGFFDNVGTSKVTADGTAIETVSGGIRNSSWHFFAPPAPSLHDPEQNPRNPTDTAVSAVMRYNR